MFVHCAVKIAQPLPGFHVAIRFAAFAVVVVVGAGIILIRAAIVAGKGMFGATCTLAQLRQCRKPFGAMHEHDVSKTDGRSKSAYYTHMMPNASVRRVRAIKATGMLQGD